MAKYKRKVAEVDAVKVKGEKHFDQRDGEWTDPDRWLITEGPTDNPTNQYYLSEKDFREQFEPVLPVQRANPLGDQIG
jgi:hypothetical protein